MESFGINCDLGDSPKPESHHRESRLIPYIHSCNISCGFHGAKPVQIEKFLKLALENRIKIGAHPSYPDPGGDGRKILSLDPCELRSTIKSQITAFRKLLEKEGGKLSHIKPHGALYNVVASVKSQAIPFLQAIFEISPATPVMGLAGSPLKSWAVEWGLGFISEAFADRKYQTDGTLVPRSEEGSVIGNTSLALCQAMSIWQNHEVQCLGGSVISIHADTICLHGDNPASLEIAKALKKALKNSVKHE